MFYSYFLNILFWKIGFFVIQSFPLTFLGKQDLLQWNSCLISWNYCANRTCRNVIGDLVQECECVVPTVLFAWWRFSSGFPHHIPRFVRWPKKITKNLYFFVFDIEKEKTSPQALGRRTSSRNQGLVVLSFQNAKSGVHHGPGRFHRSWEQLRIFASGSKNEETAFTLQ